MTAGDVHHERTISVPLAETDVSGDTPISQGDFHGYRDASQLCKLGQGTLNDRMVVLKLVLVSAHHVVAKDI